jgi:hypothetical protein
MISEHASQRSYTLGEAASYLVVREDDLIALLSTAEIVVDAQLVMSFTHADVETLEQFVHDIREYYDESVYGGGDL